MNCKYKGRTITVKRESLLPQQLYLVKDYFVNVYNESWERCDFYNCLAYKVRAKKVQLERSNNVLVAYCDGLEYLIHESEIHERDLIFEPSWN